MSVWRWYRARGWGARIALGLGGVVLAAVAGYVGGRSLLYVTAEKSAGAFVPESAQAVVRMRDLAGHWERIRRTPAWRTIRRRILRDVAVRRNLNGMLKGSGLPTLDDLEDERKVGFMTEQNLLRVAGRDVMASVQVGASWKAARYCGATRLGYGDYLLAPFANWVLPTERVGGQTCLRVRMGRQTIWAATVGAVAVASNDRTLLAQALERRGKPGAPRRPVEGRLELRESPLLADLARGCQPFLPFVKFEEAAAVAFSLDLAGTAVTLAADVEGPRPGAVAPPARLTGSIPAGASGFAVTPTGSEEVVRAIAQALARAGLVRKGGEGDFLAAFLPYIGQELSIVVGAEEYTNELEGVTARPSPTFALLIPSSRPREGVDAITALIKRIAGHQYNSRAQQFQEGDVEIQFWRMGGIPLKDFLTPCYAALKDAVIFGNNLEFVREVIQTAEERAGPIAEQAHYRAVLRKGQGHGLSADAPFAALFFPPMIYESMDGLLPQVAAWEVSKTLNTAKLRAEAAEELSRLGEPPTPKAIDDRYFALERNLRMDREGELRQRVAVLENLLWLAVQAKESEKGTAIAVVLELR